MDEREDTERGRDTERAERPPSKGRATIARLAVLLGAAVSVVAGLECSPSLRAKSEPRKPLITAERPRHVPRNARVDARWTWPAMAHFDSTYDHVERNAKPVRLARGTLAKHVGSDHREVSGVVLSIAREAEGEGYELGVELTDTDEAQEEARFWPRRGWKLATGPLEEAQSGEPLVFENGTARIRFEPTYLSPDDPIPLEALDAWSYVAALLSSDEPVYADLPGAPVGDPEEAIRAAKAAGDKQKALSIYRTWQPMGRCSMDTRPAAVAREYAELCYEMGKTGCFLQLQLRIMGDQFERVIYSSYGEASHDTEAERLEETGLDTDAFLLGLALRFGGVSREGELGPWRLARSIKESGRMESITAKLAAFAKDDALDAYNRLRATQMLALLEEEAALGDESALTEVSRLWLAQRRARASSK